MVTHEIDIEAIRSRISVPHLLDRFGIKYRHNRCACPVHKGDNNQAFSFTDEVYFCHTNGCKGDIFSLYSALANKDFKESVLDLANLCGLSVNSYRPTATVANMRVMVESPRRKVEREWDERIYFAKLEQECLLAIQRKVKREIKDDATAQLYSRFHSLDTQIDALDAEIQGMRWKKKEAVEKVKGAVL